MAVAGWILDKSAASRAHDPGVATRLAAVTEAFFVCAMGRLEQLYSARSSLEYEEQRTGLDRRFPLLDSPPDILDRALALQRALARHHGLWHRVSIPDLLIAETALHHGMGVIHVDGDFERIAEVRPLSVQRVV